MLYVNYYEMAGIVISSVLFILMITRGGLVDRRNKLFFFLLLGVLSTGVADYISSFTISYPYDYPLALNYFVSIFYLFSYVATSLIFVLYADSVSKIPMFYMRLRFVIYALICIEAVIMATSPWTRLIVYFDENREYIHGPLFAQNYIVAAIALVLSLFMVIRGRVKFSRYQIMTLLSFGAFIISGVIIQLFLPEILLAGFALSVSLIFLYVNFENPAYVFWSGTKCYNGDTFFKIVKSRAKEKKDCGIVVASINDYRNIEQILHATQRDNLNRWIADRLYNNFGKNSYFLFEDKFAVIIEGKDDGLKREDEAVKKIHGMFKDPVKIHDRFVEINVTCAILPFDNYFANKDELAEIIDMLLEMGESSSEHAIENIDKVIKKKARHDELIRIIADAIEADIFKVYYQPIYNSDTGQYESAEALVRLFDEKQGFISPEEFIPIAEQAGLIIQLGEIVFNKVCNFIKEQNVESLGVKYIEVNLSPLQCEREDISDVLFSIMKKYSTDPSMINFEITETAESEFNENSSTVKNIQKMNKKGIAFSIDDFGSGFAATDYLFKMPVDLVKVDKGILWQAMKDEKAMVVLRNTFRMVKELDKEILVEGVETQEMVDMLKENGCHYMQGYFFSKPIPEDDYVEFLRTNNLHVSS